MTDLMIRPAATHHATAVCPCGSTRSRTVLQAERYCVYSWNVQPMNYELRKCKACGLVRTWPPPPHEEHAPFRDEAFLGPYLDNVATYEHYLSKTVDEIANLKPAPGRLLDIGANIGTIVRLAGARGYDAVGLELNEAAVDYARDRGLNVICAPLEAAGLKPRSFDVISMSATAEHIEDFDAELGLCFKLLRPGGLLYVSNSPNYGGFGAKLEGDLWYGIQPTGHVWQFTPRTLKQILKRSGFEPFFVRKYNLHREFGRGKRDRLRKAAFHWAERLGLGDALSVGAVRP